jgi:hypothetical protein
VLLKGVTAGVVNIVRSFLSLFAGRRRKGASRSQAAADTAATHAGGTADDEVAATLAMAVITGDVASVIGATAFTTDATATAAETAATKSHAATIATADAAIGTETAATSSDAASATDPATADTAAIEADAAAATAQAASPARPAKSQGRKLMSSGFDMQAEIAKLAERIIEPVAAKLTAQQREQIVGQIRDAFEKLYRTAPDASFENMAVGILEPVDPNLTDAERRRGVDRLSGAMAAFCQGVRQRAA